MSYPNDNYANATALSGASGSITPLHYDGIGDPASSEAGETYSGAGETLWWKWTAPSSGAAAFTTSGSPSDTGSPAGLDTQLQAFAAGGFADADSIGFNDDGDFGTVDYPYNSRVVFAAVAGDTYWIQLDQYGSGQAGTVHLSWEIIEAGVNHLHMEGYSSLADNVVLPSTDDNEVWADLFGTALPALDTITFSGGASATITNFDSETAGFIVPLVGGFHSGPAVITGAGGYSKTLDITVLKPETPGFTRTFPPRTVTQVLPWHAGGGGDGLYMVYSVIHSAETMDDAIAAAEGTTGQRDAFYGDYESRVIEGITYPRHRDIGMTFVSLGWGPSGFGQGFTWGASTIDPALAPAPANMVVGERSATHFGNSRQPIQQVWTAPPNVQLPIAAMAQDGAWSEFTAEIYAIPAADIVSNAPYGNEPMPYEPPLLLPPAWFEDHEPLAVIPFGSIGDNAAAFATADLTVPFDAVWQAVGAYDIYSVLVVIMKQYREAMPNEGTTSVDGVGNGGWIRVAPHPDSESPFDTSGSESPADDLVISVPIQEMPYRFWIPDNLGGTLPPLRQVGRADRSRQYPRAHVDGSRQVGRIP